jgi:DNA uptake protein ComE-like DNA-binding protein
MTDTPGTAVSRGSELARSWWVLLAAVPFAFTTWAAFLYAGVRARSAPLLASAAGYLLAIAAVMTVIEFHDSHDDPLHGLMGGAIIVLWAGGLVHALLVRRRVLARIDELSDPTVIAAERRIRDRDEGRRLARENPVLARELGVGRPDKTGARSYGVVDVNSASATAIAKIAGPPVAQQIVAARGKVGGFTSLEDMGLALDLPPDVIERMRDYAIFLPPA